MVDPKTVIVTDPEILGGSYPVFQGTRVPFKNLLDYLKAGKQKGRRTPSVGTDRCAAYQARTAGPNSFHAGIIPCYTLTQLRGPTALTDRPLHARAVFLQEMRDCDNALIVIANPVFFVRRMQTVVG